MDLWSKNRVHLYFNEFVQKIDNKKIYFKNKSINHDLIIWCGGIKANSLSLKINEQLKNDCKFGVPVNEYLEVLNTKNVFALGDCGYNKLPPSAQVSYQEGKYLANNFNNDFKNKKKFIFNNKGQICYIGKGKSVYNYKKVYFHGNLTGYLNNYIHLYNAINFEQSYTLFKDIFNKNY
jgi:NADH dehydrogenase FAD-containing subunit